MAEVAAVEIHVAGFRVFDGVALGTGRRGRNKSALRRSSHADDGSSAGSADGAAGVAETRGLAPVPHEVDEDREREQDQELEQAEVPAPDLLRKAAGVDKGAGNPKTTKVGTVTADQVREIAELKMKDLNAVDVDGAIKQVEGTARSMGIEIAG